VGLPEQRFRPEGDPYRVVIFGPGGLGTVAIWELSRLPEFELVGVRAYSEAKNRRDAGEMIGIDPLGIEVATDPERALAIDSDCVLYTARDMGNRNTDDEIVRILEAGRNVVTPLPYQNAALFRDREFVERLEQACATGSTSFHATGIDPDLITDRVVLSLTGMCTHLEHLTIRETWPANKLDPQLLGIVGFGQPPEEVERSEIAAGVASDVLHSIGRTAERALGVTYERVEERHDYVPTETAIDLGDFPVEAGTVGRVTHSFHGWIEGREHPFFTMQYNWILGWGMLPPGVGPNEYWVAEIEGTPSARMVIDLRASLASDDRFYEIGSVRTDPGYHGTIAPCLQAIPHVCAADPGVVPSFEPPLHWRSDLREPIAVR
jgi:hypothetical protein